MAPSPFSIYVSRSTLTTPIASHRLKQPKPPVFSSSKLFPVDLPRLPMKINVLKSTKNNCRRMLDGLVNSMFQFVDQPLHPLQKNLAPVEEIGEAVEVINIEGKIPADFPEGLYIRNGSNHLFGGPKSAVSVFGKSSQVWVEGEGMVHALYFEKNACGDWIVLYKNKYVESETFKVETQRKRPTFLPTVEGDSWAVLAALTLNMFRYGIAAKHYQNVNVFEHAGKLYSTSENYLAQEIEIPTLATLDNWDINGAWDRPFTSHPKIAPGTGELVIMGVDGQRPYWVVGVVSADGKKLLHKVDLQHKRSVLSHEIGVTQNYNVLIDHPLLVDITRTIKGGSLIKYEKQENARIGVMPRYGDADSIKWFEVEPNCTFHIVNCFEDGNQVVVRGCKASMSIIPGPDWGRDKHEWFARGFQFTELPRDNPNNSVVEKGYLFHHIHEWRLNMVTGEVIEKRLTGNDYSMDFPFVNQHVTGLRHKYAYTQVVDSLASSSSGMSKYGGLAKLYFDEDQSLQPAGSEGQGKQLIHMEYQKFPENVFCAGSSFVPKQGGAAEDDGWIVTLVHNERSNVSQAYIMEANKFGSEPIAILNLPQRVPYGHHAVFVRKL